MGSNFEKGVSLISLNRVGSVFPPAAASDAEPVMIVGSFSSSAWGNGENVHSLFFHLTLFHSLSLLLLIRIP